LLRSGNFSFSFFQLLIDIATLMKLCGLQVPLQLPDLEGEAEHTVQLLIGRRDTDDALLTAGAIAAACFGRRGGAYSAAVDWASRH